MPVIAVVDDGMNQIDGETQLRIAATGEPGNFGAGKWPTNKPRQTIIDYDGRREGDRRDFAATVTLLSFSKGCFEALKGQGGRCGARSWKFVDFLCGVSGMPH